jgi:hypothetical protein
LLTEILLPIDFCSIADSSCPNNKHQIRPSKDSGCRQQLGTFTKTQNAIHNTSNAPLVTLQPPQILLIIALSILDEGGRFVCHDFVVGCLMNRLLSFPRRMRSFSLVNNGSKPKQAMNL